MFFLMLPVNHARLGDFLALDPSELTICCAQSKADMRLFRNKLRHFWVDNLIITEPRAAVNLSRFDWEEMLFPRGLLPLPVMRQLLLAVLPVTSWIMCRCDYVPPLRICARARMHVQSCAIACLCVCVHACVPACLHPCVLVCA
jgi:hypothetical protein